VLRKALRGKADLQYIHPLHGFCPSKDDVPVDHADDWRCKATESPSDKNVNITEGKRYYNVPIQPTGSVKTRVKVYAKKRIKRAVEDIAGYRQDIRTL
jgi:hypothetical protein